MKVGEEGIIVINDNLPARFIEMGFVKGQAVKLLRKAPLGNPYLVKIMNAEIAIRKDDASKILVQLLPH